MRLNNKAISSVVTTVLIVLIAIVAVSLIWVAVSLFFNNFSNSSSGFLTKTKFELGDLSLQNLLAEKFKLKNTGQTVLTEYKVTVDGIKKDLVVQKRIEPQEEEYLSFTEPLSLGEHNLVVTSNGYTQSFLFNIVNSSDWHIVIQNISIQ